MEQIHNGQTNYTGLRSIGTFRDVTVFLNVTQNKIIAITEFIIYDFQKSTFSISQHDLTYP